ncbi:MAG: ATP phosphoribosyltransferase, partial [Pseudomonadota bacterium]
MSRLTIAIPSKGRLKENAESWLTASGFKLRQKGGGRGYSADLKGLSDAEVMLLSAREIAEGLISGQLHVG